MLGSTNDQSANSQIGATSHFTLGSLRSTTRVSYLFEEDRFNSLGTGFNKLLVASVPDLQSADPTQLSTANTTSQIRIRERRTARSRKTSTSTIATSFSCSAVVTVLRCSDRTIAGRTSRVSGAWRVTQDIQIPGSRSSRFARPAVQQACVPASSTSTRRTRSRLVTTEEHDWQQGS